jgi:hypothetical protein
MADSGSLVFAVLATAGLWVWTRRARRGDRVRDASGSKNGIVKRASRTVIAALSATLGFVFFSSAVGLMMAGVAIFAGQIVDWLRWARWEERAAAEIFTWLGQPYPVVTWQGVQRILDFVFGGPLTVALFLAGAVVMVFATIVVEDRG